MGISTPCPFIPAHETLGFDCGKESLNKWLVRYSKQSQASGSARTYVVAEGSRVIGYYSLTVGQVDTAEVPERVRRGMGRYPIPIILLARLAVDLRYHGKGIGTGMIRDAIRRSLAISEQAGVRAIMTHPLDDEATRYYRHFGFVSPPNNEKHLLLLLKDAKRYL